MASIQFDYSTLSTSISRSELSTILDRHIVEHSYDINEETGSHRSSTSSETYVHPPIPQDKFKFVYLTFGFLGLATLLPWNFFITANDYWMYKFRDSGDDTSCHEYQNKSVLQASFTSYLAVDFNVPYVIFLLICMLFNYKLNKMLQVIISLCVMIILFIVITAFVEINTEQWETGFFALTLVLVGALGISSAILQSGISGVASLLPPKYIQIMFLGQAVAGIIATVAQILSLIGHCDSLKSAMIYFCCADAMLLIALASYFGIQKTEFFKYHVSVKDMQILKDVSEPQVKARVSGILIYKLIWPYALTVLFDLWVTIGIFPGLAVLSVPSSSGSFWTGKLYLPICCFLLFNVGDFCGRAVAGWLPIPPTKRILLLLLCSLRLIFIPLFIFCNLSPRHIPVLFPESSFFISFITLMGITNGYFLSVAMVNGIKSVNPLLQEAAGVTLTLFLGAGLMLGAVSSYAFIQMI